MTEKTYTHAQLCKAIEKAHGRITKPFSLQYPSDPRCRFTLRIYVECGDWDMCWCEAENGDNVARLLGIPEDSLVSFSWNRFGNQVLKIVVREE